MRGIFKEIWTVLKDAFAGFSEDKVLTLGAALAYYTTFSIAPLLIIAIAVAAKFFDAEASRTQIFNQLGGLIGPTGAQTIQGIVENASCETTTGIVSTIISVIVLLAGASGVFGQLQDSLNIIWRVQPVPGRSMATIFRQRLLSLSMVMVIAFLLLVSLMVSTVLSALGKYFSGMFGGETQLLQFVNFVVSFGVVTLLFAAIFKVLPDVHLGWGDVWRGALITSLLFTLGKFLIGMYLGRGSVTSAYGAAGSLIGILVWVYYSSVILFFGAEITRAYVKYAGHKLTPKPHSEFRPELQATKSQQIPVAQ